MKIKELLYQTPEMTEEKLLEIIDKELKKVKVFFKKRIERLHKGVDLNQAFLDEYDLIQDKKSYLTKTQRDFVVGLVGYCMIQMTKGNDGTTGERTTEQSESESTD